MSRSDTMPIKNPSADATTPDKALFDWIFSGLVRMKQGTMNPDPAMMEGDLAESWKSSSDGKQWTFNLRKGVQCHHGYGEFTADDVVYSLARAGDPKRSAFSSDIEASLKWRDFAVGFAEAAAR